MRYSEAVKRHKLETKQRILNSILEAAEKEKNASPSADNRGYRYGTEKKETIKKETITMKSTQINEVRGKKGGVIAAACAILMIGGGLATLGNSTSIDTYDIKNSPVSSSSAPTETSSAAEQTAANTEKTAVKKEEQAVIITETSSAAEEAAPVNEIKPIETTVSEPETTTTIPEKAAAAVSRAASFNELFASSDTVLLGTVSSAEPQYIEMSDGSTRYVIRYTLTGDFFVYNIVSGELHEYYSGEKAEIFQYADEGTAPQFKTGETAMFMAAETGMTGADYAYTADPNGAFSYSDHQLYSVSGGNAGIASDMFDYMLDVILPGKDSSSVTSWIISLGGSVSETVVQRDDLPSYNTVAVNRLEQYNAFELVVNHNAKSDKIRDLENGNGFDITPDDGIISEKLSGFDNVDIELKAIAYYPGTTYLSLYLEATPKAGFKFKPDVVYNLKHDFATSGLNEISVALNADATMITEGYYNAYNDSISFEIAFDQAGNEGQVEFDLDSEFTFTINGISASDGQDIFGEYKFTYKYNPSVADYDNVKIVTRSTATNKY
jgi:hypothetical protein